MTIPSCFILIWSIHIYTHALSDFQAKEISNSIQTEVGHSTSLISNPLVIINQHLLVISCLRGLKDQGVQRKLHCHVSQHTLHDTRKEAIHLRAFPRVICRIITRFYGAIEDFFWWCRFFTKPGCLRNTSAYHLAEWCKKQATFLKDVKATSFLTALFVDRWID